MLEQAPEKGIVMRVVISAIVLAGLIASACAIQKTYQTVLDVCSSGNGTVKSAKVVKSSGDPELDKYALEKVGASMVYAETSNLTCKPLTVDYKVTGEV
jgi:hypothetical protein